ncbi:TPA: hypothetical protein ACGZ99_002417 [Elizabethkingia anophelis]
MKKFKLTNAKALEKSVKSFDNPILKKAVMQVIDGELGGWTQHGSWTKHSKEAVQALEEAN